MVLSVAFTLYFFGLLGFWWCYFYDRDLGFMMVYCCLPMVITFVVLFVLCLLEDVPSIVIGAGG